MSLFILPQVKLMLIYLLFTLGYAFPAFQNQCNASDLITTPYQIEGVKDKDEEQILVEQDKKLQENKSKELEEPYEILVQKRRVKLERKRKARKSRGPDVPRTKSIFEKQQEREAVCIAFIIIFFTFFFGFLCGCC